MRRKPAFVLILLVLLSYLLSIKINPVEVKASNSYPVHSPISWFKENLVYEQNLSLAAKFLNNTQFNPTVGLCRESPKAAPNTYWLVSDNLLAYHALMEYYPETAEAIYATMIDYGFFRSFKHEAVFGTTIPSIPIKKHQTYIVAQIGADIIKTKVCNGTCIVNYHEYADLCLFTALHYFWSGDVTEAISHFDEAEGKWDGTGLYDKASQAAENESKRLIYSTDKLALLLYVSRVLDQPLENKTSIQQTLWFIQDKNDGGLYTDYDVNLNYTGSDMNTETTSLAILAYKYKPKVVNRPAQHSLSLNTPPDYQTVQEAIDNANEGDTVFVYNGVYYENVVLDKRDLTLVGQNRCTTVIDGDEKNVVFLKANNTKIKGFTLQNGYHGILMGPWTNGHIICNNIVVNNDYGISGHYDCVNISICGNTVISNSITGIVMLFSNGVISNNLISDNGKGEFLEYSSGIQIVIGVNNKTIHCINNTIFGNTIKNNRIGIWAIRHSEDNCFFHNNFVNNKKQILVSATPWNNNVTENYWSNYDGIDGDNDGVGDTSHVIDDIVQDNHPLMGMFHCFNTSFNCLVNVVSNSTIEDFAYFESNSTIRMYISNMTTNQTHGFCRICIPHALMNVSNISVNINDGLIPVLHQNYTLYDNATHRWIYFAYEHSPLKIDIIPEFTSLLIIPLFMIATLLAVIVYKRKTLWNESASPNICEVFSMKSIQYLHVRLNS